MKFHRSREFSCNSKETTPSPRFLLLLFPPFALRWLMIHCTTKYSTVHVNSRKAQPNINLHDKIVRRNVVGERQIYPRHGGKFVPPHPRRKVLSGTNQSPSLCQNDVNDNWLNRINCSQTILGPLFTLSRLIIAVEMINIFPFSHINSRRKPRAIEMLRVVSKQVEEYSASGW